jgi:hypothetical protein
MMKTHNENSVVSSPLIDFRNRLQSAIMYSVVKATHYKGPRPLKVIVTGSPRSGTSFVTGLIHLMGFSIGPKSWLKKADRYNPYGYFECQPLNRLSSAVLMSLGDFHSALPSLEDQWTEAFKAEQAQIVRVVESGGVELYKDNLLLVLADLYDELFPDAKWVFVQRDIEATYKSRFGRHLSFSDWQRIVERRSQLWQSSNPSKKALYIDYDDFKSDIKGAVQTIQTFLDIELSKKQLAVCIDFFKPRK